MAVNNYSNSADKSGFLKLFEAELYAVINCNKHITHKQNIGIIDWWWCTDQEQDTENIKKFVEMQDICFFISDEILNMGHLEYADIDNMITMLNDHNVYFLMHSEESGLTVSPKSNRTLNTPWFYKSFLDIPADFEATLNYKPKPYMFNLLLGRNKTYRTLLYKILKHNPQVYSTYLGHHKYKHDVQNNMDTAEIQHKLCSQDMSKHQLNTMLDTENGRSCISHIVPTNIYNNTHFDIVSETQADKHMNFTTEKTAKPLATGRFFLYAGVNDVKKYLTQQGFSLETYNIKQYDHSTGYTTVITELTDYIEEITENPGLVEDIYTKTLEERIYNMHVYQEKSTNYYKQLNDWIEISLNNLTK